MEELKLKSGIYKITINDYYIYIGQSMDVMKRWSAHLNELKRNRHCNKKFQNVFNKYPDSIKFEIIELCDIDMLDSKEMYWIAFYRSFGTNRGLNLSIGGDSNRKYRTKEEAETANKENHKQWYQDNKKELKVKSKRRYQDNREELKVKYKQYRQDNKEKCKEYAKQYYQDNIKELKVKSKRWYQDNKKELKVKYKRWYQDIKKQKGILSRKERFETHYSLSRPLTDKEWDIWINTKNKGKSYAIKYLKTLPNLTFTLPLSPKK